MQESSIRGVSVRAWLALFTVISGLSFLYGLSSIVLLAVIFGWVEMDPALQLILLVVNAVTGFIGLALGYYLGQKTATQRELLVGLSDDEPEA